MAKKDKYDNLPMPVLETYDMVEKLLCEAPIVETNRTLSNQLLNLLTDLYELEPTKENDTGY